MSLSLEQFFKIRRRIQNHLKHPKRARKRRIVKKPEQSQMSLFTFAENAA